MTANSADAQKLWGYVGGDGGDGGEIAGNSLVRQAPNDAGPVVYSDFLFNEAAAGGAYSLIVDTAVITLTGGSVALRRALRLTVSSAAIALTGESVGAKVGRKVAVTSASVMLAGQNVATRADRRLPVTAGAVPLSGSTVTPLAARRVSVASATVTLTGSDVGLAYTSAEAPQAVVYSGGSYNFLNPRRYKVADEDDDDKPEALEVIKIGDAPKRQIITGIVAPVRKARTKEAETLKRLSRQRVESERARAEHIRRIIAADDEWLMTV